MKSTVSAPLSFPVDPWAALDAREPEALARVLPGLLADQLAYRGAPRDPDAVVEFLERFPPTGDVLVHGAGTHTARLLPLLEELDGVRIVGIVDKLAQTFESFRGYTVSTPRSAATLEFDVALLSNELWEMQMRTTLLEAGIPAEKIRGIYVDPRYRELAAARHTRVADELPRAGCDFAIVDFTRTNQRIVDEVELSRVLPPARTVKLFSQRFATEASPGPFRTIGFRNSLDLLGRLLQRANPELVYLRTFIEDNLCAALVRHFLPETRVVHEIYDWSLTIEPDFLRRVHGHADASIQAAMAGELYSLREADFVISKRGGNAWERVMTEAVAEHAAYFPQLCAYEPREATRRRTSSDVRVVYAGNLPAPNTLDWDMVGGLFPLFETLTREAPIRVSVFNGSHADESFDERFRPYAEAAGPRLAYHRAVPYAEVLEALDSEDYGWMYFPRDGIDFVDEVVLISNKFVGYVSAGLPVIIDDGWEYMASLVKRFDAGVVHSMYAPEELAAAIASADLDAHRRGVLELREFLIAANDEVLQRLRTVVQ